MSGGLQSALLCWVIIGWALCAACALTAVGVTIGGSQGTDDTWKAQLMAGGICEIIQCVLFAIIWTFGWFCVIGSKITYVILATALADLGASAAVLAVGVRGTDAFAAGQVVAGALGVGHAGVVLVGLIAVGIIALHGRLTHTGPSTSATSV